MADICVVTGCERPRRRRDMCGSHHNKWLRETPPADRLPPTEAQRFWAKVRKSPGCWEWQAGGWKGYGQFVKADGSRVGAHRYALESHLGYPPPEGMEVCHRCDNPPCVNPAHLYYGTRQDNVNDAHARGQALTGERSPSARLKETDVVELRTRYAAGAAASALAAEYGVAESTVRGIVLGLKWKHTGGPITRRRHLTGSR